MAARAPSDTKRRRRRRPSRAHRDQGSPPTPVEAKQEEKSGEEEQGFLFDPYWDEIFAAYYDPCLGTCCQFR